MVSLRPALLRRRRSSAPRSFAGADDWPALVPSTTQPRASPAAPSRPASPPPPDPLCCTRPSRVRRGCRGPGGARDCRSAGAVAGAAGHGAHALGLPSRSLLSPRWMGPFRGLARTAPNTYRLDIPATWRIFPEFNVERLRPYRRRSDRLGGPGDSDAGPPPPAAGRRGARREVQELLQV